MNIKEQINANIKDSLEVVRLRDVDFYWKFSMSSFYDLLATKEDGGFGYETERNLMNKLMDGSSITLIEVFYVGIVWDNYKEKISFRDFLIFLEYGDITEDIKDFLEENLSKYLYPKKKRN